MARQRALETKLIPLRGQMLAKNKSRDLQRSGGQRKTAHRSSMFHSASATLAHVDHIFLTEKPAQVAHSIALQRTRPRVSWATADETTLFANPEEDDDTRDEQSSEGEDWEDGATLVSRLMNIDPEWVHASSTPQSC